MLGIVPSLLRRNTQFSTCMAHISSRMPTCAATAAAANIHQPDASYAVSEIASHLTRQSTRGPTKPASKAHTVFHMYGTHILLYANMCCNCYCCQHPPTGCIICSVRNNQADAWRTFEALRLELAYNSTILLLRQGGNALLIPYYPKNSRRRSF